MFKLKSKKFILGILLCLCAALFALFPITKTISALAYNASNMPKGDNAISNIYKDGVFVKDNLDALAQKVGYTDLDDMVDKVSTMSTTATSGAHVKKSSDFGDIVVNFGSYSYTNDKTNVTSTHELTWMPAFLSNTTQGPVLTLWLADVGTQDTDSSQESSHFSDGSYGSNAVTFKEPTTNKNITVYGNSYDGSYLRNYVINGRTTYAQGFGTNENTASKPAASKMTKFTQLTSGALAKYIVEPKYVSWQANANYTSSDPKWTGTNYSYYTANWINDKLWIPSVYEVCNSTISANSRSSSYTFNGGGLWGVSMTKLSNSKGTMWLRSAESSTTHANDLAPTNGKVGISRVSYGTLAVRPALHLNLSKAAEAAEYHEHEWLVNANTDSEGWSITREMNCSREGRKQRVCIAPACTLTNNTETDTIEIDPNAHVPGDPATCTEPQICDWCEEVLAPATGHTYSNVWSKDETNHWHAATCGHNVATKDLAEHDWNSGKVTTEPTCTQEGVKTFTCNTCGQTKTEPVDKSPHNYSTAWTKDETNHWHECTVCHAVQPNSTATHSGGTANCQQKASCEVCGQTYGDYGGHVLEHHEAKSPTCTEIGWNAYDTCKLCDYSTYSELAKIPHTYSDWKVDKAPTCTETGSRHKECTVCQTTLETETISSTGHDYSSEWTTDGSNHWHICANECGIKGSNAAHGFAWVIDKKATFTEAGKMHQKCETCNYETNFDTEIPMQTCAHDNAEHHAKVPATCSAEGTVEYKYCPDCQKNLNMAD
ncbi:MAG: hypothetical protein K2O67_00230, partial [Clostridia bacterium]|nr:hypothetical protein [Clostridia bacterium]